MIKKLNNYKALSNIIMFLLTTGTLTYYAENSKWKQFWIVFIICALLYIIIEILNSKYLSKKIVDLENKEFKYTKTGAKYGLSDFLNIQENSNKTKLDNIVGEILNNGESIKFSSITATSLLDSNTKMHFPILQKRYLEQGRTVKILITNPVHHDKNLRDELYQSAKNPAKLEYDLKYRLRTYLHLIETYDCIDIRVSDYSLYCSLLISNNEGIYEPYNLSKVDSNYPNKTIALHFTNGSKNISAVSYYRIYNAHFDNLFEKSIPLKDFIKRRKKRLASLINVEENEFLKSINFN